MDQEFPISPETISPIAPQKTHSRFLRPLLVVAGIAVFAGIALVLSVYLPKNSNNTEQLVGGDRDAHGCIGSAGYSWCEASQKCLRVWEESCGNSATTTNDSTVPIGKKNGEINASVGEKIGEMTIVSIEPFNSRYSAMSPENVKIIFKGPIVITGTYGFVSSPIGFDGYCMENFDTDSLTRLPYLPVDNFKFKPGRFCFRNALLADSMLGKAERVVTVKINNYELNSYPSEVVNWADLLEVVK